MKIANEKKLITLTIIRLIMVSITRFSDLERLRNTGRWILVYGRRINVEFSGDEMIYERYRMIRSGRLC
jgi:hypothetical protein